MYILLQYNILKYTEISLFCIITPTPPVFLSLFQFISLYVSFDIVLIR